MVRLVRDSENRITVRVVSTVDYSGFSASLSVSGIEKIIPNLRAKNIKLEFSPSEVTSIGQNAQGVLTVYNAAGEIYINNLIWFETVETEGAAVNYQAISIVLVSLQKYEGGKIRPDGELDKIIDEKVDKAMTESVDAKVEEYVDEIIDDKVATSVDSILGDKVEQVVGDVIDEKVDSRIDELLDSSDSDALGGIIGGIQTTIRDDIEPRVSDLENKINNNIEPRITAIESVLDSRITLADYSDSDEDIVFRF